MSFMDPAATKKYAQGLSDHADAITAALAAYPPEVGAFMRAQFDLAMYPVGFTEEFAAALNKFREPAAEATGEAHAECHDLVCSGDRRKPRGAKGVSCSCRGRDVAYKELADRSAAIAQIVQDFYRDEGESLSGKGRLMRCKVCSQGWITDGAFASGARHSRPCPVEGLEAYAASDAVGSERTTQRIDEKDVCRVWTAPANSELGNTRRTTD